MAKRIKTTKSKYSESYSIIDDYVDPNTKKRSTFVVEKLGSLSFLKEKYNVSSKEEVFIHLNEYLISLKQKDSENNAKVSLSLIPNQLIPLDEEKVFNLGYLYPKNILHSLGIKSICNSILDRHKFQFDLTSILSDLVSTRLIYPGSKRSSYNDAHHFLDHPNYELEDVYRSLPILSKERYFIQSELYKNSKKLFTRNTSVLYYDCTNFYFEIEEEDEYRKYGKSKENRPNPIVQYGLFMDGNGLPIADICFEGNKNEQFSLIELEKQIEEDFQLSKFVVCADAGLNGWENKVYNNKKKNGAYIVTQPVKKLKKNLKEWATDPDGWKVLGHENIYNINELEDKLLIGHKTYNTNDLVFYKERWEHTTKKTTQQTSKYKLEEHLIVTYSQKYKKYQAHIRDKKIERAKKLLKNPGKLGSDNPRNPRYYIQCANTTKNGEVAEESYYSINEQKIIEDSKYDGIYAVVTDLDDTNLSLIIQANKQRWEIEESFEIMKYELEARPIYVSTEAAINGHLLTCFISLLVYRILEKEYLKENYTCSKIFETLRKLNVTHVIGNTYIPSFKRTEMTDELAEIFGFQPAREVLTQKYLNKFNRIVKSRKSTKINS